MSAKLAGRANHRTAAAAFDYQVRDQVKLGFGREVALFRGDGDFVAWITRQAFIRLADGIGLNGERLRRPHPKASRGELLCLSLPAGVTGAMKLAGRLADPKAAFALLAEGRKAAMAAANAAAYGRTTGGKPVKGDLLYAVFPGHANRAGEACPQFNVWVFPTVRAASGKHYALHTRPLYYQQKAIHGAWHLGVAHSLRNSAGIVCGPDGNSFTVPGVRARTRRAKQMRPRLKKAASNGPRARARAARESRGKKVAPTWARAVARFRAWAVRPVVRVVAAVSAKREARLARHSVKAAFRYCNANARRYTRADAYATAAHLALPHVRPAVLREVFDRLTLTPGKLGAAVKTAYANGGVLYESTAHASAAEQAAMSLWALERKAGGGVSARRVAKALAGSGCTARQYAAVGRLTAGRRAVVDPAVISDPAVLRLTARAYAGRGRDVYAVGADAGRALEVQPFSAFGLAETLTRTSHMKALWRGLRTPGTLDHKLWAAEQARANGHTRLRKGSLVVASVADTRDAKSLARIAETVRAAGAKLIVTGEGAREFAALAQTQAQRAGASAGRANRPAGQRMRGARL